MFVMLICCVSAASAADVDNITVPDDTDVIEIDEAVDSVEEVESDGCDASDYVIEEPTLPIRSNSITLTPSNYTDKFSNGYFNDTSVDEVIFVGNFTSNNNLYDTLKFNQDMTITATGSTFNNIGFGLYHEGIVLNGATIIMNAPQYMSCYALDIEYATNAIVINNHITYTCNNADDGNYNYVIKVRDSENVTIDNNTIKASLPLRDVDYSHWTPEPTIDYDLVSVVAVESSNSFKFTRNVVNVTINNRTGDYPTLSSILIVKSNNTNVAGNKISVQDMVTGEEEANFLYAIDIYKCYNLTIDHNKININSDSGNLTINGTGAAYGIQLTGPHTGVVISNNNITTANNGPNLGIYSQNTIGETNLTIKCNIIKVTGRAGTHPWALVSGMELQDTYATVCGNTIDVTNVEEYTGGYVYGISYCQSTSGNHTYIICNNTVRVPHGEYAVYLDGVIDTVVTNNWLYSYYYEGDAAVEVTGTNITDTGNFPE